MTVTKTRRGSIGIRYRSVRIISPTATQWADLPIVPVRSAGTDNARYRLGDDMIVRLPRIHWATGQVDKEHEWLPRSDQATVQRASAWITLISG